jgi:hypothetical protein
VRCDAVLTRLVGVHERRAVFDPLLPPYNEEASQYQELGSAALFGGEAISHPTIEAIQAVCLMFSYEACTASGPDHAPYTIQWTLMGWVFAPLLWIG